MVVDDNDSVLDPHKINWKRLNKTHFPYQLKQRRGRRQFAWGYQIQFQK